MRWIRILFVLTVAGIKFCESEKAIKGGQFDEAELRPVNLFSIFPPSRLGTAKTKAHKTLEKEEESNRAGNPDIAYRRKTEKLTGPHSGSLLKPVRHNEAAQTALRHHHSSRKVFNKREGSRKNKEGSEDKTEWKDGEGREEEVVKLQERKERGLDGRREAEEPTTHQETTDDPQGGDASEEFSMPSRGPPARKGHKRPTKPPAVGSRDDEDRPSSTHPPRIPPTTIKAGRRFPSLQKLSHKKERENKEALKSGRSPLHKHPLKEGVELNGWSKESRREDLRDPINLGFTQEEKGGGQFSFWGGVEDVPDGVGSRFEWEDEEDWIPQRPNRSPPYYSFDWEENEPDRRGPDNTYLY